MYTIYADDRLLYSPSLQYEKYDVLDPTISSELNRADNLTFRMFPTNPSYGFVADFKTEIRVYDDKKRIFRGRVTDSTMVFDRQKNISAESDFAYLNDVVIRPYEYSGSVSGYVRKLLHLYNMDAVESRRFGKYVGAMEEQNLVFGNCTVTDSNDYIVRANKNYPTVREELVDKLANILGGYFVTRCEVENGTEITYIDYLDGSEVGTQTIQFAENLLDLSDATDASDIYTVIIPLGATVGEGDDQTRIGIAEVTGKIPDNPTRPWGKDYIENADGIAKYGRVERVVIWDDVTIADNLFDKAYAAVSIADGGVRSFEVIALDLHDLGVDVDAMQIGKKYSVVSVPHGYVDDATHSNRFQLVRIDRKLSAPDKSVFTFGRVTQNLTRL